MTDIATDPNDMVATIGTNVILTCIASGADNLMYHWIRLGNENTTLPTTRVNTNTLTINSVSVSDSGKYSCVVSSGDAIVTSECGAVNVLGKIYILTSTCVCVCACACVCVRVCVST